MADDNIKTLIKKRASLKSKLTIFDKFITSFESLNESEIIRVKIIELNERLSSIETLLITFDEVQSEIEALAEDYEGQQAEREEFENKFHCVIAKARLFQEKHNAKKGNDAKSSSSSGKSNSSLKGVKLPEIDLPKFDGMYETWLEFRGIFESMIHNNTDIKNIQKFHYLKASLVGAAPRVIQSIEFKAENYPTAWETLCDRFDDKDLLVQNHISAIFSLETIRKATSSNIRELYENLFKHLSNIKQLGESTESWDTMLIFIAASKLDSATSQEWQRRRRKLRLKKGTVTLIDFKEFLKEHASSLQSSLAKLDMVSDKHHDHKKGHSHAHAQGKPSGVTRGLVGQRQNTSESADTSITKVCAHCKGDHWIFYCPDFLKLPIKERTSKIKELRLCFNCLRRNHAVKDCRWSGCKICGHKHNTVLHDVKETTNTAGTVGQSEAAANSNSNAQRDIASTSSCAFATTHNAILSTVKVQVRSSSGDWVTAKALLDCGSQSSFMTSELFRKLGLPKTEYHLAVCGINDKLSYVNYKCDLSVQSMNHSYAFNLQCFILDKITANVPDTLLDITNVNIPSNISLADPDFFIPQPVDILIGADAFWRILSTGQVNTNLNGLTLQNTRLGWIVTGSIVAPCRKARCNLVTHAEIQKTLSKFWEVEEIPTKAPYSLEEQACEEHFGAHLNTSDSGRYVVTIPLKESISKLGDSREIALRRFMTLERRLLSNETLRNLYIDFMREYEQLGHMSEDTSEDDNSEYFMPHHGVLKESSTSTKLRVVFNASAATSTGFSLNDLQMKGPTIQQDLMSILLRFRIRSIVLSSDIKMMYRQVLVNPSQHNLQKIFWRSNPSEPVKVYKLKTVTYGTKSASFLAIRCLHEVASECEGDHPIIAKIIKRDMYVDDLLTSVDSREEAMYIRENITNIFRKRGFELRKWKSNDASILSELNANSDSNVVDFVACKESDAKTLGLSWKCDRDVLTYRVPLENESKRVQITKRTILSKIATIFDPLGLISPCIIIAKTLLQRLWSENLTWDQSLPDSILHSWLEFASELPKLNDFYVNRQVAVKNPTHISLHGFADASEHSYGACVYVVSKNSDNECMSNLLCAKAKVAPIKTITIPRLELCAAVVLSHLVTKVIESIDVEIDHVFCWSDSTIVLAWIKTSPNLLQPFVANRVSTIQGLTHSFTWKHVPTCDNPADIVSRGLLPKQLIQSRMWFHGPSWLCNQETWPDIQTPLIDVPERRKTCIASVKLKLSFPFERFSDLNRIKRVCAYVLRFIKNCRSDRVDRKLTCLNVEEVDEAFSKLILIAQADSFSDEYNALQRDQSLPSTSKILSLHPFLDNHRILRVGGRLSNSDYPYSKKHPILLSPKHHLTKLIFESEHKRLLHAGPQLLLSTIRDTFWPIAGRNLARKVVHSCVKCARYASHQVQPIMGDLPASRVHPSVPFTIVGVDYAGPFVMKDKRGRGCKPIKCWIALFICFSTRAIHLELVLSLSCDDFLQAFNRFISRRGCPSEVYSDNGTNFVKANKELKDMGLFLQSNYSDIIDSASILGIKWHFIPTNSPHFGGLWESGVKSVKHHLKRVLGNYRLFFFDLQTLLVRIEAVLNTRPLFPLNSSPDDLTPLTPAHFLIGRSMMSIPERSLPSVPDNRLSQYQLLQRLYEHFWTRWSREYISELQQRSKWKRGEGALKLGQLVLIKDNNLPPCMWRLGRVIRLIEGQDSIARVASIKTANGVITRAVARLAPLPVPVVSESFQGGGHVPAATPPLEHEEEVGVATKRRPTSPKTKSV